MSMQDSNLIFLIVVIALAVYAFRGHQEGFIRTIFHMFSLAVALLMGFILGRELTGKIIVFLVARLILWYACFALNIISKLPILNGINRAAGILAGLFRGIIVLWILCIVLTVFVETEPGKLIYHQIETNQFLTFIYENNPLHARWH